MRPPRARAAGTPAAAPARFARRATLALALLSALPAFALEAPPLPFATHDRNPLVAVHGLPDAGDVFAGHDRPAAVDVSLDVTNTLHEEERDGERLFIDGEFYRLTVRGGYTPAPGWVLQATLPFAAQRAGGLDAFIDDFHALFGFPEGDRPGQPRNRLAVSYTDQGQTLLDLGEPREGPGDLRLALGRDLADGPGHRARAWLQLKLPTGDPERLTGSGAPDLAAWVSAASRGSGPLAGYASAGLLLLGDGDVVAERQNRGAWFASLGGHYAFTATFALQMELSAHSALYDSDTRALGPAAQLASGGWLRFAGGSLLHVAVIEDIHVGSAPDVTFHLAWRLPLAP